MLTDGAGAICILDNGETRLIAPPMPDRVEDVTGAGDALAGASLAALMGGSTLENAVAHGLADAGASGSARFTAAGATGGAIRRVTKRPRSKRANRLPPRRRGAGARGTSGTRPV